MKYIFKEFRRHLWRTIASISGYIIATMFILLIIAVTSNNEKDTVNILKGTGTHFIVYIPSATPYRNVPFLAGCSGTDCDSASCVISADISVAKSDAIKGSLYADGVYTKLLSRNFLSQIKQTEGVKDATPYLLYKVYDEQFKSDISIGGMMPESLATQSNVCAPNSLIEGKFFPADTSEIIAEESFSKAFNLHLGDTISFCSKNLNLVGIINSGVKPGKADLYSTFDYLKQILKRQLNLNMSGSDLNVILVEVDDAYNQDKVMEAVKIQSQYATISTYACYVPARNVMAIIGKASSILYIIIILFLVIFATKTQTISLMERMREIGILKSLGWSNRRIGKQIFAGSMIQAVIGSITGSILALMILFLLNHFKIQLIETSLMKIQLIQIFTVFVLSLTGGIIASIFPIIKICRLSSGEIMMTSL